MNFNGNYRKVGEIDVASLKGAVLALSEEEWNADDWRQKEYAAHQYTQTISLLFDRDFRHAKPTRWPMYDRFDELLAPARKAIEDYFSTYENARWLYEKNGPGYFIRIILVNLKPGGRIPEHFDAGFSLSHAHRIHLPVITSGKTYFSVGGEEINMKEGDLVEINNRRPHAVRNESEAGRVHFILDWVIPGESCCCAGSTHMGIPCSPEACHDTCTLTAPCGHFPY